MGCQLTWTAGRYAQDASFTVYRVVMRPFPDSPDDAGELSGTKRSIRAAAMRCFAEHGVEAASMRMVAVAAGVSVGLVQHHFRSKAALIEAVNTELITIVREAAPAPIPPEDTVADVGARITALMAQHPAALDYLAHLLISNDPTGQAIFDALVDIGRAQWSHLSGRGLVRTDFDPTWGPLNPLVLVLGTLILRSHIDRNLPAPLSSPGQLRVWETALNSLINDGHLRQRPAP